MAVVIPAIAFLLAGGIIFVAAVVALVATVEVYYLSGSGALADDGLQRGSSAPAWSLPASPGGLAHSPPRLAPLQLIVFSDHSLKSFPSVADGLRSLAAGTPRPDILVLTRQDSSLTGPALEALGLGQIPVVTGSPSLYGKYNVRVMPFVIAVDDSGQVRASSLVNHAWQVDKLWRLAQVAPGPGESRPRRRPVRRPGWAPARRRMAGTRV